MQSRIKSLDLLRGVIMVLMAIDHTRVYAGVPAGGPDAALFFTRWVTHFCVSGFVFFAGTGIFLYGQKINDPRKLSRYLLSRGLLLMLLELTLIRFCWTFNLDFSAFILFGVIWMLGCCMVLMAALTRLSVKALAIAGLVIVVGQQAFHFVPEAFPKGWQESVAHFWNFFYPTNMGNSETLSVLYVIIPWIGVMMVGYAFGRLMLKPAAERNKYCYWIGGAAILLFLVIGSIMAYQAPPGDNLPFLFRLLSQRKYPASPLFLLMTLGPLILSIPLAERAKGWLATVFTIFGRVPLFYYLLHIPLIHILALGVNKIRLGQFHQDWYGFAPFFTQQKEGLRWGLPLLYLVFLIAEIILYFFCRWYARYKAAHPEKSWLKYI
jgi:uncharacterized membrane protein